MVQISKDTKFQLRLLQPNKLEAAEDQKDTVVADGLEAIPNQVVDFQVEEEVRQVLAEALLKAEEARQVAEEVRQAAAVEDIKAAAVEDIKAVVIRGTSLVSAGIVIVATADQQVVAVEIDAEVINNLNAELISLKNGN